MKVSVLLADKGTNNPAAGTLNLLNVGWGVTKLSGRITAPHAVAVFFEADLAECNRPVAVVLELVNDDGQVVDLPGPAGPQPMRLEQSLTIVPPGGAPTGTVGKANTLLEIAPGLPLAPGTYSWRVTVDGHHEEHWTASFYVAPPPAMPTFGFGGAQPPQP